MGPKKKLCDLLFYFYKFAEGRMYNTYLSANSGIVSGVFGGWSPYGWAQVTNAPISKFLRESYKKGRRSAGTKVPIRAGEFSKKFILHGKNRVFGQKNAPKKFGSLSNPYIIF